MIKIPIIDSHTHINSYNSKEISEILNRTKIHGINSIIDASVDINSAEIINQMTKKYPHVFGGIGFHPQNLTKELNKTEVDQMYKLITGNKKILVISEIGLDFQPSSPSREIQYKAFRKQIGIARELNKPIIFHSRLCADETIRILKEERAYEVGGAMHYFQSNNKIASELESMGFKISVGKPLLRTKKLENVINATNIKNIIVETDSAPQPFKQNRANWTEPKDCNLIIDKISQIKNENIENITQNIFDNTFEMLKHGSNWLTKEHLSKGLI
tara:strand:+ start:441 stop:1259 length:819 start_codon:yes stop_codon:yes gene_type:complete